MSVKTACPHCGDHQKPGIDRRRDPESGRVETVYRCRYCQRPWRIGSDGEAKKVDS